MAKALHLRGADYTQYMQNRNNERQRFQKMCWDMAPAGVMGRIFGPNGRILCWVRQDPGEVEEAAEVVEAPIEEEVNEVDVDARADSVRRQKNSGLMGRAPSPRGCQCKSWPWDERQLDERGKPKLHHPKCAWNKAWMRQKGHGIKQVPAGPTLVPTIHQAGVQRNSAVVGPRHMGRQGTAAARTKDKLVTIPSPDKCPKCSHFTKSKKMDEHLHHPTCEYYKKHKLLFETQKKTGVKPEVKVEAPKGVQIVLIDLKTQTVLREAEADEVAEARRRLRDEGSPLCEVDSDEYLVTFENGDALEPAEPETLETKDTEPPTAEVVEASP